MLLRTLRIGRYLRQSSGANSGTASSTGASAIAGASGRCSGAELNAVRTIDSFSTKVAIGKRSGDSFQDFVRII